MTKRKTRTAATNKRYKTLGFKWLYKQHLSHQSWLYLDSEVLRNPQRFHTAKRYA